MESGTGVYYQAMPAVGPDGKNVMKLIPVQKVNGQFVQTQVLGTKNNIQSKVYSQLPQIPLASSPPNRLPALQAIGDGRFILKAPSKGNTLVDVESQPQGVNDLFKNPISAVQLQPVTPKMTKNALQSPFQNKNKVVAVINSPQLPVTVKSPVLPSGHYLQIPPNATVRTLPASALPQSIKKRICNSATVPSNPVKGFPTVVYISPVNSLKLGSSQQLPSLTKLSELPQTLSYSPAASSGENTNISSTCNSKTTQGVTGPMKWVVKEETRYAAPCLIPVTSPSMTSDILKAVKQMEAARLVNTAEEPTSTTSQEKVNPGKDNALVMYNGKVYFVAKKDSDITKDVIAGAENDQQIRKSAQPSSTTLASHTSNTAPKKVSKTTNEIIDLCGEDDESLTCPGSDRLATTSEMRVQNDDDSNVIFVSYIPPKSESEDSHNTAETAPQTQQNSCEKGVNSTDCDTVNMGKEFSRSITSTTETNHNLGCQDNTHVLKNIERRFSVSEQLQDVCDQGTDVTETDSALLCRQDTELVSDMSLEKPALHQKYCQKSDFELRQLFGITSDLRICLQRINLTKEPDQEAQRKSINKRTLEGIRRIIDQSQIKAKTKHPIQAQVSTPKPNEENCSKNSKRQKMEKDGISSIGTIRNSSTDSKDPVKHEDNIQLVPITPCVDSEVLPSHPKEKILSCIVASETAQHTTEPLRASSSLHPAQTPRVMGSANDGVYQHASRKTLPRVSRRTGRMCTACPCQTKVGSSKASPLLKPERNSGLPAVVKSSRGAGAVSESNIDCHRGDKIAGKSISSSPECNVVTDDAGDEVVHSSRAHVGDVCSSQHASPYLEDASQWDSAAAKPTSSSSDIPLSEQGSVGEPETTPQEPHTLKKEEGKVPSSLVGHTNNVGDGFPFEFLPSLVLDHEELNRQERIRRLKDLLREKEAALKKLRQSM